MRGSKSSKLGTRGFTLIELMIVVAIIGILAAIAIPKFAELIRKSSEGASKGNLGAIRSALSIYYGDMEGQYPDTMPALTINGKYLTAIPVAKAPNYHTDTSTVLSATSSNDSAGWVYNNTVGNANQGTLLVNCTHTDTKGSFWTAY
jgi:prepilin-type N-terminal cleavage/methylation domain-containing protein